MATPSPRLGIELPDGTDVVSRQHFLDMLNPIDANAAELDEWRRPFYLRSATYDGVNNRLVLTVGQGRVRIGGALVQTTVDTTVYIASPSTNTTYTLYAAASGGPFVTAVGTADVVNQVQLWQVATGAGLGTITMTDVRSQISAAASAPPSLENNQFLTAKTAAGAVKNAIGRNASDELVVGDTTVTTNTRFVKGAGAAFTFEINGTVVAEFTSTGLGIGMVPSNALDVTGTARISGAVTLQSTLAVTGAVTGGTYNGQTITSAASFTGSVTAATYFDGSVVRATGASTPSSGSGAEMGLVGGVAFFQGFDRTGSVAIAVQLGLSSTSTTINGSAIKLSVSGSQVGWWTSTGLGVGLSPSYKLDVSGQARISSFVGVGVAPNTAIAVWVNGSPGYTGTDQYGVASNPTFTSAATSSGRAGHFQVITAASAFTMTNGYSVYVANPSLGAGSAVTTVYGLYVEGLTAGGTNYAVYTAGTTPSSFGGAVTVGAAQNSATLTLASAGGTSTSSTIVMQARNAGGGAGNFGFIAKSAYIFAGNTGNEAGGGAGNYIYNSGGLFVGASPSDPGAGNIAAAGHVDGFSNVRARAGTVLIAYSASETKSTQLGHDGTNAVWQVSSGGLVLSPNNAEAARYDTSGNWILGSNLATGAEVVGANIYSNTQGAGLMLHASSSTAGGSQPQLAFRSSHGTVTGPADVVNNDVLAFIRSSMYSGGSWFNGGQLNFAVDGTFTSGQAPPSRIEFYTNLANSSQVKNLTLDSSGNLIQTGGYYSIGSTVAQSGTIRLANAFSVRARNQGNGNDTYVISTDTSNEVVIGDANSGTGPTAVIVKIFNGSGATFTFGSGNLSVPDNSASLGGSSARWSAVWAVNGTIQTSLSSMKENFVLVNPDRALAVAVLTDYHEFDYLGAGEHVAARHHIGVKADKVDRYLSPDGVHVQAQSTAVVALAAVKALALRMGVDTKELAGLLAA